MTRVRSFTAFQNEVHRRSPRVALILGSGLGALADRLTDVCELSFVDVPDLCAPSIPGHRGSLLLGDWANRPVLVFAGRLHGYEGHPWERTINPVQLAHALGAETLVVTNAAGGIRADLPPGTLMVLRDHLEWTRPYSWRHPGPAERKCPYSPALREKMCQAAANLQLLLPAGIYAQVTGPSYETKAEIHALRTCGADAVGMSTAREVQAGFDLGMQCVALSCITNKAAGLADGPINHEEVLTAALAAKERLADLLEKFLN